MQFNHITNTGWGVTKDAADRNHDSFSFTDHCKKCQLCYSNLPTPRQPVYRTVNAASYCIYDETDVNDNSFSYPESVHRSKNSGNAQCKEIDDTNVNMYEIVNNETCNYGDGTPENVYRCENSGIISHMNKVCSDAHMNTNADKYVLLLNGDEDVRKCNTPADADNTNSASTNTEPQTTSNNPDQSIINQDSSESNQQNSSENGSNNTPQRQNTENNIQQGKVMKGLNVMYTNADCLSNKMDLLRARAAAYEPDIICINEVKPKNYRYKPYAAESSMADIGYDMIPNNLDNEIGRGQIIYYAKDRISLRLEEFGESKFEEAVFASMKLSETDSLLVGLFYRSGSGSQLNNKRLNTLINGICNKGFSHMLLVGDFNYPDADWEKLSAVSTVAQTFIDTTLDNFLHQHVDTPTRYRSYATPSTIDLVFSNEEDMVEEIEYNSAIGLSDHLTLLIKYNCYWSQEQQIKKRKLFHKADYMSMKKTLVQTDWLTLTQDKNYAESCNIIETALNELIDKHVPEITINSMKHKIPIEKHVRELIKQKDQLCRKEKELKKQKRFADADKVRKEYVKVRNRVRKETRSARKNMENDLALGAKTNTKRIYAYMNSRTKLRPGIGKICKNPNNPKSD